MSRLPLVVLLALLLGPTACSNDSDQAPPVKTAAHDAVNPCTLAWDDQQVATTLRPATPAVKPAALDGDVRAGLAADGVCFDVSYEMYTKGWKVLDSRITAAKGGVVYSDVVPHRVYLTQFDAKSKLVTKPLPGLYVPLKGCVDVTARVDLTGPHGVHGAYTATATYGRGCATYTGGPSSGS
jgi:hypothetical protein